MPDELIREGISAVYLDGLAAGGLAQIRSGMVAGGTERAKASRERQEAEAKMSRPRPKHIIIKTQSHKCDLNIEPTLCLSVSWRKGL